MKPLRRAFHVLLALAVICMLTISAFAVSPYQITVQNSKTEVSIIGSTYSAYKLFNVSYNTENRAYSYTYDDTCLDVTYTVGETTYKSDDGTLLTWLATPPSATELRAFADYVYETYIEIASAPTAAGFATATAESVTIDVSAPGYYLVYGTGTNGTSTVVASVSLTTAAPTVTVQPKLNVPTLDKQIKHNEHDTWGKDGDNQINDKVFYHTITNVPDTTGYDSTYVYEIHDTMTSGLTYNDDLTININNNKPLNSSYYKVQTTGIDAETFVVDVNILKAIVDGVITTSDVLYTNYSATLNENAVVYPDGSNDNTAYLTFSNNPYDNSSNGNTPPVTVYDWTFRMGVNKVDDKGGALSGAEFVLNTDPNSIKDTISLIYDSVNHSYTATSKTYKGSKTATITAGSITIKGLDDHTTYYLHETKAPDGYNLLADPISFVINAEYDTDGAMNYPTVIVNGGFPSPNLSTNVVNSTGILLPGTGGMGTRMFYAVGGTLTAGAGIVLVTRKRIKDEK